MKKSTLKLALIGILLIFAFVPTLVLGVVGTFATINYSKEVRTNELKTVSLTKSGAIEALFTSYGNQVQTLAKMSTIVETIEKNNNAGETELNAFTNSSEDILDCLILDKSGNVVSSSRKLQETFEHFEESGLSPVSGLLHWDKYDNADGIYFSHEVKGGSSGTTTVGYVVCVVNMGAGSRISQALSGRYVDNNAYLMIVDSNGNTVDSSGKKQTDASIKEKVDTIFRSTEKVNESTNLSTIHTDKAGKNTITYGVLLNVVSWRWVGVVDTNSISSFASSLNIKMWLVSVIVFALSALIAFAVISKFVANMQKMLKSISTINTEEGVEGMRFDTKHDKSELGSIQQSFNEFMDEVYMNGERYRTIAALSDNMLFEWDFHKERMYVSDNILAKFDLDINNATLSNGRFLDSLMEQEFADKYKRDINTLLKNQGSYSAEYQLTAKSGAKVWVSCKATCVSDRMGDPLRVIGVMTDIDNEKKLEMQLSERASFDFLSQLFNRSTFIKKLSTELDHRGPNKIGMMFIDVDDFKFINDRYGHAVGDEVIRFVADTIRLKVDNRGGFAGRFGGDEFVLCYTNQEDIANLEQIAMDLIDELYIGYTTADGMLINVRASIGISYCPLHTEDANELIAFADTAMYFVKKNGKTNYHVYVPEDSESGEYNDPEF
ncbi:MAG: diguanylate cyclase [Oscillospiraceae bacterium]|nr:diguanylate cyclase [Oscillospiraceae bacterium]